MAKKTSPKMYGRAIVQPQTLDKEKREVEVVFATETPVFRFGWNEDYNEVLSCEENSVRTERIDKGLPVFDNHNTWTVSAQLGRATEVWFDNREAHARIQFSKRTQVEDLFQDITDGIVTGISVGYRVFKYVREPNGEGELPVYRAIDWMPTEISFAPLPADINSGVRSQNQENEVEIVESQNNKRTMEPNNGTPGAEEVTTPPAQTMTVTEGNRTEPPAGNQSPVVNVEEIRTAATQEERTRLDAILVSVRAAKLSDTYGIELYLSKKTVEECRQDIISKMVAGQTPPVSGQHTAGVGVEGIEKKRDAIQEAILHRVYPSVFKLKDGKNEYRGMTLMEIGKELLADRGVSVRGLEKSKIVDMVFSRAHSTSDFPILFEGAIEKMLRAEYVFASESWNKIARETSVSDFREKGLYQIADEGGMTKTPEGGEIKYTTLKEAKQRIYVEKFARGIRFTREAFINDDLDALERIPMYFVRGWDKLRGDLVWQLITKNVKMEDGKNLFSTEHNNLLTGAKSVLSEEGLETSLMAFRMQKDLSDNVIRVTPKTITVPPQLEVKAKKLLTAIQASNTTDVNVFSGAYDILVEPRLVDAPTAWYLMADPNEIDGLYYAYLDGNSGLRVNSEENFNRDTMDYAVRAEFGTAAVDFRGMVKMAGA